MDYLYCMWLNGRIQIPCDYKHSAVRGLNAC